MPEYGRIIKTSLETGVRSAEAILDTVLPTLSHSTAVRNARDAAESRPAQEDRIVADLAKRMHILEASRIFMDTTVTEESPAAGEPVREAEPEPEPEPVTPAPLTDGDVIDLRDHVLAAEQAAIDAAVQMRPAGRIQE